LKHHILTRNANSSHGLQSSKAQILELPEEKFLKIYNTALEN